MSKTLSAYLAVCFIVIGVFYAWNLYIHSQPVQPTDEVIAPITPTQAKKVVDVIEPPESKVLATDYHIFQRFNNCGPAALSMALRFYGIEESQEKLGADLRPYQVASGDNDDKSVTLEELAIKSLEYGFVPYHRPGGNYEMIKKFIAYDIPIITRTWTKPNEDIGHYRVVKGYDDSLNTIIQDDSLQDKNLWYAYSDFELIWEKFNNEFLVLVPEDKVDIADAILGDISDERKAWKISVETLKKRLADNPEDIITRFNLSVALYNIDDFEASVNEFERVERQLPMRALWYQIEPIEAYFHLGNYDRVFEITNSILSNHNRAYSELYLIRGEAYKKKGRNDLARAEYEKAVFYNKNSVEAKFALETIN